MEEAVKRNADASAFPNKIEKYSEVRYDFGLTKREYFAGLVMQGIVVNAGRNGYSFSGKEEIVKDSVKIADELLSELNNTRL